MVSVQDQLVGAVGNIYAAALEPARWERAMGDIAALFGGAASTFELIDRWAGSRVVHAFGVPPETEIAYAEDYAATSPRVRFGWTQAEGDIGYDRLVIDPRAMDSDPFYAEFLPPLGLRYFISGIVCRNATEFGVLSVHRSPEQGHVEAPETELMVRSLPHLRDALEFAVRVERLSMRERSLAEAFDAFDQAVVLVAADGAVVFANAEAQSLFQPGMGLALADGRLRFCDPKASRRLLRVLAERSAMASDDLLPAESGPFVVRRRGGHGPLTITLRPLPGALASDCGAGGAAMAVFAGVRAPSDERRGPLLRDVFGLTRAEVELALALLDGTGTAAYAEARGISANTAYTHLRRIKEKTGTRRQVELIHKLHALG